MIDLALTKAFQLFDLDKDGYIDYHELKVAMKALGFECSKQEITAILTQNGIPATTIGQQAKGKNQQVQQGQASFVGPGRLVLGLGAFQTIVCPCQLWAPSMLTDYCQRWPRELPHAIQGKRSTVRLTFLMLMAKV